MKRKLPWLIGVVCVGVALAFVMRGGGRNADTVLAEQAAQSASAASSQAPAAPSGPVVYTFKNDEQMRDFAKLWQQRQGVIIRMNVLNAYMTQEKAELDELNKRFTADYHLDVTKRYELDTNRRVIIEREAAASSTSDVPSLEPAPAAAKP